MIDLNYLQITFDNSPEMIKMVIDLFINQTPGQINDLKREILELQTEQVKRIAHKLKSSFLTIGAKEVAQKLEFIEHNTDENNQLEIKALIEMIEEENNQIITQLQNL